MTTKSCNVQKYDETISNNSAVIAFDKGAEWQGALVMLGMMEQEAMDDETISYN